MSNTFVPQTFYEKLRRKKKEKFEKNISVNVIKELFKEFLNAQQEAQKYPLCSSFYKFFTDRRTARIKVLPV